ncbi:MAG TPA: MmcQ/YjbR family DNA-binding protein [Acidimicrobiales bacterium]
MDAASIDRVQAICSGLPECEIAGEQHHKLSVRGRTIGWHTVDHHGDGRVALTVRVGPGENAELVASDPKRFFMPPYVARHRYVGVYLDLDDIDWGEVRELITDAYRIVAPKKLAALVE